MADKVILRVLADGQLSASVLPLYVVNNDVSTEVHQIILSVKGIEERTINIYLSVRQTNGEFGPNRLITPQGLILDPGDLCYVLDDPIQLNIGDRIMGTADLGSSVDYVVTGLEYTK